MSSSCCQRYISTQVRDSGQSGVGRWWQVVSALVRVHVQGVNDKFCTFNGTGRRVGHTVVVVEVLSSAAAAVVVVEVLAQLAACRNVHMSQLIGGSPLLT